MCDTAAKIGTETMWNDRIAIARDGGLEALVDANMQRWFSPAFHQNRATELGGFVSMFTRTPVAAYHRQHHCYYYGDEAAYESIRACARAEQALVFDYLEAELAPYLCGNQLTAADFYLYMLSRWDVDKTAMRAGRPKLNALLDEIRARPTVDAVLAAQPRRKVKA